MIDSGYVYVQQEGKINVEKAEVKELDQRSYVVFKNNRSSWSISLLKVLGKKGIEIIIKNSNIRHAGVRGEMSKRCVPWITQI